MPHIEKLLAVSSRVDWLEMLKQVIVFSTRRAKNHASSQAKMANPSKGIMGIKSWQGKYLLEALVSCFATL